MTRRRHPHSGERGRGPDFGVRGTPLFADVTRAPEPPRHDRTQIPLKLRRWVFVRDAGRCVLCGAGADIDRIEVDHIRPVCKGGTNDPRNLRLLCAECNAAKRDRDPVERDGRVI